MYGPTILAVYGLTILVVDCLYTSVWANYAGGVWPSYIGHTFIIHWCMSQLYWPYITHTLVYGPTILAVYRPAILAIHSSYTSVWANDTGNFIVGALVYEPTSLVVH